MTTTGTEAKLLVVDDEPNIRDLLASSLRFAGFDVVTAEDGSGAFHEAQASRPDLIVLDVMLPDMDGFTVTRRLRDAGITTPVLFLTARDDMRDKIQGLTVGGDDYVTKPFAPMELVARVRSQLRRYTQLGDVNAQSQGGEIVNGRLCYRPEERVLLVDGEPVKLTATELKIVDLLMRNLGRVFPAEEIYRRVWNEEAYATENTVMVHIRRIREKIELNPKEPEYLKVVWGIGYKIEKR